MTDGLYAIKDELSGYGSPVPIQDDAQAIRWFRNMLTDNRLMASSPKDFSLWKIAGYNTTNGNIQPIEHILLERGKETE